MDLEDLLAPVAGSFDIEEALADWQWLVPQPMRGLVMTAMGDLFLIAEDDSIFLLDTFYGTCERVAASQAEWEEKLGDQELTDVWFLTGLVLELRETTPLAHGQCYTARLEPALGGSFEAENFYPISWRVHLSNSGRLHQAIKDLPPGTKITKVNYTEL